MSYTGFHALDIRADDYFFVVMGDGTLIADTASMESAEKIAIHFRDLKHMNVFIVDAYQVRSELTAGDNGTDRTEFIDVNGYHWRTRIHPSTATRAAMRDAMWNGVG